MLVSQIVSKWEVLVTRHTLWITWYSNFKYWIADESSLPLLHAMMAEADWGESKYARLCNCNRFPSNITTKRFLTKLKRSIIQFFFFSFLICETTIMQVPYQEISFASKEVLARKPTVQKTSYGKQQKQGLIMIHRTLKGQSNWTQAYAICQGWLMQSEGGYVVSCPTRWYLVGGGDPI